MAHALEDKLKAATYWLITGSFKEVSAQTGIPERTLRYWSEQPWWETLLEEAKNSKNQELDAFFTQVIHACTEQMKDRITNGDSVVAGGQVIRVPVKLKDLASTAAIAMDRRSKIRSSVVSTKSDEDRAKDLKSLADELSESKGIKAVNEE